MALVVRLFQWMGQAVAPACGAVPPGGGDVEARMGGRGSVRPDRAVLPVLESGRAVVSGRYRPYYHLSLEPMGGSALSILDWSI
jgi:hypothetical protein